MTYADIQETFRLVAWGSARTIPIAWSVPAFGGPSLPVQVRLAMGVGLSFLCLPALVGSPQVEGPVLTWLLVVREALVGVVIAFVGTCLFRAAEAAGRFADILRGANTAEVIAPGGEWRSSPLGSLMLLLAAVVFFEIDGLAHVTSALLHSYEAIPLDTHARLGTSPAAMARVIIVASARLIESAVALSAPVIVALLLAGHDRSRGAPDSALLCRDAAEGAGGRGGRPVGHGRSGGVAAQ